MGKAVLAPHQEQVLLPGSKGDAISPLSDGEAGKSIQKACCNVAPSSSASPPLCLAPLRGKGSCPAKLQLNTAGRQEAGGGTELEELARSWHRCSEVELRTGPGLQARSPAGTLSATQAVSTLRRACQTCFALSHPSDVTESQGQLPHPKKKKNYTRSFLKRTMIYTAVGVILSSKEKAFRRRSWDVSGRKANLCSPKCVAGSLAMTENVLC